MTAFLPQAHCTLYQHASNFGGSFTRALISVIAHYSLTSLRLASFFISKLQSHLILYLHTIVSHRSVSALYSLTTLCIQSLTTLCTNNLQSHYFKNQHSTVSVHYVSAHYILYQITTFRFNTVQSMLQHQDLYIRDQSAHYTTHYFYQDTASEPFILDHYTSLTTFRVITLQSHYILS